MALPQATYTGRIDRLEIGTGAAANTDITNVVLMNWERNHDIRPRLFANSKYPTDYQQPHSWIVGTISLLSDYHDAFYNTDVDGSVVGTQPALDADGDSTVIDWLAVFYRDEDNNLWRSRFQYAIISRPVKELLNYDDSVYIYHFLAGYEEVAKV